jgi:hypothetical protein
VIEADSFSLELEPGHWVRAQLAVVSYLNRINPAEYTEDQTDIGPRVATGRVHGLYTVRDFILKAPEDQVQVALQYAHARRGEIDISIAFAYWEDPKAPMLEALRCTTLAVMALLNIQLGDHLTPVAPLQVSKVLSSGQDQFESSFHMSVLDRARLMPDTLEPVVSRLAEVLSRSQGSQKLRTALELYGSHFNEPQARTRFLLLVIATETLATPRQKHRVALQLAEKWQADLASVRTSYADGTDEHFALSALERELLVRTDISIRSQVRELFTQVGLKLGLGDLAKRALRVYDQRSKLVHDGALPANELGDAEREARELLELAIKSESS